MPAVSYAMILYWAGKLFSENKEKDSLRSWWYCV